MQILFFGSGFVGTCTGAALADSGHDVALFDINEERIKALTSAEPEQINRVIFEEGLPELIGRNKARLHFFSDQALLAEKIAAAHVIFFCIQTPTNNGQADLSFVNDAWRMLVPHFKAAAASSTRKVLVLKSTVPIAFIKEMERRIHEEGIANLGLIVNPEFLAQGQAIEGSIRPARVVVGGRSEEDFAVMRRVYHRYTQSTTVRYLETSPEAAMAGKFCANFTLFAKLVNTYDVIGRVCELYPGISFEEVRKILAADPRIGTWGLYDSLYAGGSCFVKDAESLSAQVRAADGNADFINEVLAANKRQLARLLDRVEREAGRTWSETTLSVFGAAFKQGTNDVRNSGATLFIEAALSRGLKAARIYDPVALPAAAAYFSGNNRVSFHPDPREALKGSTALIIATDWPEFQTIDGLIKETVSPPYLIIDARRILPPAYDELAKAGYTILPVGGALITP